MKPSCPKCGTGTVTPHPVRFSPHDKYAKLRQPEKT
ncbi:MAG: nucleolar RNA-binding Nop10p family protein [Candidatus Bathyarchaeia archaeon]